MPIEKSLARFQQIIYNIEDLAADGDIAARAIFAGGAFGGDIQKIGIVAQGSAVGVDNSNTVTVTIADAGGNVIVTKVYSASPAFPANNVYDDLGVLNATHKLLTANEVVTLAITQNGTANIPPIQVVISYANYAG